MPRASQCRGGPSTGAEKPMKYQRLITLTALLAGAGVGCTGIHPGRRLDAGRTGWRSLDAGRGSRWPRRTGRSRRKQPDARHGRQRPHHPADEAQQPGHARRSERGRADADAPADQPRIQQHRPRPAGRDHEAGGHVPAGSRLRVPVPARRRRDRRRLREHQRRGRGHRHRRRQQDRDAGPLHRRRGRLRPRLHHQVRPARLPPPAGPAGGRSPVRPVPGRAHRPDDELRRRPSGC